MRYEYQLTATIRQVPEKVNPLRVEAGFFVLLTNLIDRQDDWPVRELLGIEENFSFLKDPVIVNSIMIIAIDHHRQLAKPLKPVQIQYLKAQGVTADAFAVP